MSALQERGRRPLVEPVSSARAGFFGRPGFYFRVSLLGVVAAALFTLLALRLWSLQVLQGPRFARLAQGQSFRTVDLPAPRAAIVDRNGLLLAGTSGRVALVAEADTLGTRDEHGVWTPSADGRRLLATVARVAHEPLRGLVDRIARSLLRSPFAPAVVVPRLDDDAAAFLSERAARFPGLHVVGLAERSYPQGALGGEFLGLIGEISTQQLARPGFRGERAGLPIGQSGIEGQYDRLLNGGFERSRVAVDSRGRSVGALRVTRPAYPLPTLKLTVDAGLQRVALKAVRDGIALARGNGHSDADAGAAVVMDARTGALYALASHPGFNQVAAARDPGYLSRLLRGDDPARPLVNRATQGLYPTGSTFKPIVAEAALATGLLGPGSTRACTGSLAVGNFVFHNVEPGVNATLNLPQALAISCDTWFYRLGTEFYGRQQATGALDMQHWAMLLGLGHPTGIDVPGEAGGVVPTPAWLKRTFRQPWQRTWYEGYSVNLSIGQGYLAVTPLQLAVAYAALANGGTVVRPHFADALVDSQGRLVQRLSFPPVRHLKLVGLQEIHDGLYSAAHAANGTSSSVFGSFKPAVAGKTGTAQAPHGSDHSWYASWAPAGNPRVVVVVVIEHGGFGAEAAAPAAREIYSAFFGKKR